MRMRRGATIIEFLVYLMLFSFIVFASMRLVVHFWQTYITYNKKRASFINRCVAHDMLLRDLQTAPCLKSGWHSRLAQDISWHDGTKDIGWIVKNNALLRKEGNSQTLIAQPIKTVQFTFHESNEIRAVSFSMSDEYGTVTNMVALPKRRLPWKPKEPDRQ